MEGDRNTGFYHTSALVRQRRNRISCMKDRAGNWIQGDREIVEFIRNGYAELFSFSHSHAIRSIWNPPFWHNHLSDTETEKLTFPVSNEDIAASLWSLKAFKAPGPNSLHARVSHHFWLLVGDSVREEVKSIFSSGKIPEYLNQTIITLIPKCKNPESFNHYRPISLCNTVYKIVSKIIVARLRPLLPSLVSPLQTAFVPRW